jgi:predicted amidophosphoribosyltransferase
LYAPQWLEKTHNTPKQSRLEHRQDRLQNLINAYTAKKDVAGYYVFLVDDVTTTGATLSVASDMLYTAGAKKVYGFTIAH